MSCQPVWHVLDAVCTVLDPWWWTERPSERRRVSFQKINLKYFAAGWFYYINTKIKFMYFKLTDVLLYSSGNRSRNPRVFLAKFGHHRCMERKQSEGALHNQIPQKTYLTEGYKQTNGEYWIMSSFKVCEWEVQRLWHAV